MSRTHLSPAALVCGMAALPLGCSYHHAYPKTGVGKVEVKTLPASTAMRTSTDGDYYDKGNGLFRRLFTYIQTNKVAMTVPVETGNDPAQMTFFVGPKDVDKDLVSDGGVEVLELPERTAKRPLPGTA